jgi:hypothetical protein
MDSRSNSKKISCLFHSWCLLVAMVAAGISIPLAVDWGVKVEKAVL